LTREYWELKIQILLIIQIRPNNLFSRFSYNNFNLIIIITIFLYYTFFINNDNYTDRFLLHGHLIEVPWTANFYSLFIIAISSIKILYLRDDIHSINLTVETIGCQWKYEYSDFNDINFDSFIISISITRILAIQDTRLLIRSFADTFRWPSDSMLSGTKAAEDDLH